MGPKPKSAHRRRLFFPEDKVIESSEVKAFPDGEGVTGRGSAKTVVVVASKSRGKRDSEKVTSVPDIEECHKPKKLVKVLNQGDFSGEELEVLPSSQSTPSAPPSSPASDKEPSRAAKSKRAPQGRITCDCSGGIGHHHDDGDDDGDDDDDDDETDDEDEVDAGDKKPQDDKSDSVSVSGMSNNGDDRKLLTCFYRDVPYNGKTFSFVYIKRLDKRVNFHVERIPYLVNKLAYYYSIKGKNLENMKNSLDKSLKLINEAMSQVNESDLDIPDGYVM